jgi:DNA-binding transcriptional ArsR family regulator
MSENVRGLLEALLHPLRRELLSHAVRRGELTPREASKLVRRPLSNVRYHIHTLAECGALERMDSKLVRGSWANCWRATPVVVETRWIREALELPLPL